MVGSKPLSPNPLYAVPFTQTCKWYNAACHLSSQSLNAALVGVHRVGVFKLAEPFESPLMDSNLLSRPSVAWAKETPICLDLSRRGSAETEEATSETRAVFKTMLFPSAGRGFLTSLFRICGIASSFSRNCGFRKQVSALRIIGLGSKTCDFS